MKYARGFTGWRTPLAVVAYFALVAAPSAVQARDQRSAILAAQNVARWTKVAQSAAKTVSTRLMIVELQNAADASVVAKSYGAEVVRRYKSDPRVVVLSAPNVLLAQTIAHNLLADQRVQMASVVENVPYAKDSFVPNDPYYNKDNPAAGWPGQWYLKNTVTTGLDINVAPAWLDDRTGTGVIVGVVDDGLQTNHPEFTLNYSSVSSFDFGQNDSNPSPVFNDDSHGTAIAGLISARGGNGAGITGVAPFSALAGLRVDFSSGSFATQAADATNYRSGSTSTDIRVKNHSYGPIAPYNSSQPQVDAVVNSTGLGTIHVRSAGNGRGTTGEDCNKYKERNIPETIVVGAIGSDGKFGTYSNYGASLTCVAPSSPNASPLFSLITTDRTTEAAGFNGASDTFPDADYSSTFGFTSAAAPLVTGAVALMVQTRPGITTRFVKHVLAQTCKVVDAGDVSAESDGGWKTNSAGIEFNPNYGFGLIDVNAMIDKTRRFSGVTTLGTQNIGPVVVSQSIPDNSTTGVTKTFNVTQAGKIEEIQINLNITHTWRGDLDAYLTSPSGSVRRLFNSMLGDNGSSINWTFSSNAFWGETAAGTWSLQVRDRAASDVGTWNTYSVTIRTGELIPVSTTVSGSITLGDWQLNPPAKSVQMELRQTGGGPVVETVNPALGAGGAYSFSTTSYGTYDLYVRGDRWLWYKLGTVNLTGNPVSGQSATLINGDILVDNIINTDDYLALSTYFDTDSGLPDWNTADGNGIVPEHCDLDGSGGVNTDDYLILSNNFDLAGDE